MKPLQILTNAIIRYGLMLVIGYLVKHKVIQEDTLSTGDILELAALVAAGLGIVWWAVYTRIRAYFEKLVALQLPKGSTEQDVKNVVADTPTSTIATGSAAGARAAVTGSGFLFLIALTCLTGCATYNAMRDPNATPKQKALAAIQDGETGLKFTVGPAVTTWLIMQKDPVQQQEDAAWVYGAATGLDVLATGRIPTQQEVIDSIEAYSKGNTRYEQLAESLTASYGPLYGSFQIAGTSPAQFFAAIAQNARAAAQPFLAAPPVTGKLAASPTGGN